MLVVSIDSPFHWFCPQDYDKQLQRALNNDNFEAASELRQRREQLVEAVDGFQVRLQMHIIVVLASVSSVLCMLQLLCKSHPSGFPCNCRGAGAFRLTRACMRELECPSKLVPGRAQVALPDTRLVKLDLHVLLMLRNRRQRGRETAAVTRVRRWWQTLPARACACAQRCSAPRRRNGAPIFLYSLANQMLAATPHHRLCRYELAMFIKKLPTYGFGRYPPGSATLIFACASSDHTPLSLSLVAQVCRRVGAARPPQRAAEGGRHGGSRGSGAARRRRAAIPSGAARAALAARLSRHRLRVRSLHLSFCWVPFLVLPLLFFCRLAAVADPAWPQSAASAAVDKVRCGTELGMHASQCSSRSRAFSTFTYDATDNAITSAGGTCGAARTASGRRRTASTAWRAGPARRSTTCWWTYGTGRAATLRPPSATSRRSCCRHPRCTRNPNPTC